jgi:hypothetical protein
MVVRYLEVKGPFCISASLPFRSDAFRLYLHRHTCFKLSGLYEKRAALAVGGAVGVTQPHLTDLTDEALDAAMAESPMTMICERSIDLDKVGFLPDGDDPYGYISANTLLLLTRFLNFCLDNTNYTR